MANLRAATRYAKSILELALENGKLEEVHNDFQKLLRVSKGNHLLGVVLKNPVIKSEKKIAILKQLFAEEAQDITINFFEVVSRKNREEILLDVAEQFVVQYNIHSSIQIAYLTTTFPIDDSLRAEFMKVIKEISGLENVSLVEKVDTEIIGGFVLRVNDRLWDDSISSKLRTLRNEFTTNYIEKQF